MVHDKHTAHVAPQDAVSPADKDEEGEHMPGDGNPVPFFTSRSLRELSNQYGTQGRVFSLHPKIKAACSDFAYPQELVTTKHPVQPFFTYQGAQATLAGTGKTATSIDQVLPDFRITEQDAVEWQRVGSKKGWMFNGHPQQKGPGGSGENTPTHTTDGWVNNIARWRPAERSEELQTKAARETPAIDITNRARGIGMSSRGGGGMAGGYQEVNAERLSSLPIPQAKYNWTGTRVHGTGREDQANNQGGAGGYRAGYASQFPSRPSFPQGRTTGISRTTQSAA